MRIRIVGAGVMGRGIAQWAVTAGHTVELADARRESVDDAVLFIRAMLERAAEKGRMSARALEAALTRLVPVDSPAAPGDDVELVVEAVLEDLDVKTALFRQLEEALPASTVFATNTSSLSVTRIAAGLKDPSRLAGLHFFNPVPLMKVAEVVPGVLTRPGLPEELAEMVRSAGTPPSSWRTPRASSSTTPDAGSSPRPSPSSRSASATPPASTGSPVTCSGCAWARSS